MVNVLEDSTWSLLFCSFLSTQLFGLVRPAVAQQSSVAEFSVTVLPHVKRGSRWEAQASYPEHWTRTLLSPSVLPLLCFHRGAYLMVSRGTVSRDGCRTAGLARINHTLLCRVVRHPVSDDVE